MKQFELKSVINSTSGKALNTISIIVLVAGIIAFILYVVNAITDADANLIVPGTEVLIGSIFFCIFGRAAAKLVNYVEAIYKNVNLDSDKDAAMANNAAFFPGDEVQLKEDPSTKLTVKSVYVDKYGYNKYICSNAKGEESDLYVIDLIIPGEKQ